MSNMRIGLTLKGSEWLREHLRKSANSKLPEQVAERNFDDEPTEQDNVVNLDASSHKN